MILMYKIVNKLVDIDVNSTPLQLLKVTVQFERCFRIIEQISVTS